MKNYVRAGETFPRVAGRTIPAWDTLAVLPAASAAGACSCADKRGTGRYIYHLLAAAGFWRYDTWTNAWQQLASPAAVTFAAGACMCFDPSRGTAGYVWLFAPKAAGNWAYLYYFDVAAGTWSADQGVAGMALGAQWGTDGSLVHPCTTYDAGGNDDKLFLVGNNATPIYQYVISTTTWTALANPCPATMGAGCCIEWEYGVDNTKFIVMRGTASVTFWTMTLANVWSGALAILNNNETYTTGSVADYVPPKHLYIKKDATTRIFRIDLAALDLRAIRTFSGTDGAAIAGDGLVCMRSKEGRKYLYYRALSNTNHYRVILGEA